MNDAACPDRQLSRRDLLASAGATALALALPSRTSVAAEPKNVTIVDTHVHLWDRKQFKLPWLAGAPEILRRDFTEDDYEQGIQGFSVHSMYMEVDVAPEQHFDEAKFAAMLPGGDNTPFVAAVVGGRPASEGFADYVARLKKMNTIAGVRQVLHVPATPAGFCLHPEFVRGVQQLGKAGLTFDMCMRPTDIQDCVKLAEQCPDTTLVLDHCGNGDPKAFRKANSSDKPAAHTADQWRRDMEQLAKRQNVTCKISGTMFHAPQGWTVEDIAPVVNHCLDCFGMDRVVFGSDWPVCLVGGTFAQWVGVVAELTASRSAADREKLWSKNAVRVYGLKV